MAEVNGGVIRYTLRGDDQNLSTVLDRAQKNAQTLAKSLGQVTLEIGQTNTMMRNAESASLRMAQAQARLAAAQGNFSQGANILQTALKGTSQQTLAQVNAQAQFVKMQQQASNGANTFANSVKGMAKELGVFGALFVGGQIAGFAQDLITGANDLEKAKAKVQALSKSQEEYQATLRLASQQQQVFGGSLTKNLDSLGAFLNLSQRTGVELKGLENLARRLAIVDPIQG